MTRRSFPISLALALPAALGLSSCGALGLFKEDVSVKKVDSLTDRIRAVERELEKSRDSIQETLDSMIVMVRADQGLDPVAGYAAFKESLEQSEKQSRSLYNTIGPMERTAEAFFEQWAVDLEAFSNPEMRQRSQVRLEETRERYEAILFPLDGAISGYDNFNAYLHDIGLFLGHDFNAGSIAEIEPDVRLLAERVSELDGRLEECLVAARAYTEVVKLPGRVEVVEVEQTETDGGAGDEDYDSSSQDGTQSGQTQGNRRRR